MFAMDGNNSLKRIRTIGQRQTADLRVFTDSNYYIPMEEVETLANEVRGCESAKANAVTSDDPDDEWEDVPLADVADDDVVGGEITAGDPTDGDAQNAETHGCVHNWKAAQSDSKKKSWELFEENGIFASACRHGLILWIIDMVQSGEL